MNNSSEKRLQKGVERTIEFLKKVVPKTKITVYWRDQPVSRWNLNVRNVDISCSIIRSLSITSETSMNHWHVTKKNVWRRFSLNRRIGSSLHTALMGKLIVHVVAIRLARTRGPDSVVDVWIGLRLCFISLNRRWTSLRIIVNNKLFFSFSFVLWLLIDFRLDELFFDGFIAFYLEI